MSTTRRCPTHLPQDPAVLFEERQPCTLSAGHRGPHRVADQEAYLYSKYEVKRLHDHDGKHDECRFFVLDPQHDPLARVALEAYREACAAKYPKLALSLDALLRNTASGETGGAS